MPWTPSDAATHVHGLTAHQATVWAKVANDVLARCQAAGGTDCEGRAIQQANGVAQRAPEQAPPKTGPAPTKQVARLGSELKVQAVDFGRRIIMGYAAAHANEDRVNDVLDAGASVKALSRIAHPSQVGVYIGHPEARSPTALPVGVPLVITADEHGLYTETEIFEGPVGDNLLHVARGLMRHGKALGLSIGYQVRPGGAKVERGPQGFRRRITDYDLQEYSFAGEDIIANPKALALGVKMRGGGMPYQIVQDGDEFVVQDANGEEESRHPTRAAAEAALRRLRATGDEPEGGSEPKIAEAAREEKAPWSTAYINSLPNSSFLFVEPGEDDPEGKRVPRTKRHFPYKDAAGVIDAAHLRNAIARIPVADDVPGLNKDALQGRAQRMLANLDGGTKLVDTDAPEWQTGAVPQLYALTQRLAVLTETVADEQKALRFLGQDVQHGALIRPEQCKALQTLVDDLGLVLTTATMINAGAYAAGRAARWRHELALLDLVS